MSDSMESVDPTSGIRHSLPRILWMVFVPVHYDLIIS